MGGWEGRRHGGGLRRRWKRGLEERCKSQKVREKRWRDKYDGMHIFRDELLLEAWRR